MAFINEKTSVFLSTSSTANIPNRLNQRFNAIFETRPDIWTGKRVLDIGSHDGRFSYASLLKGAAHVTGVEAKPYLLKYARSNLRTLQASPDKYKFVKADIFDYLRYTKQRFDIVLCLGFLYHTLDHIGLLNLINATGPKIIVLDTVVNTGHRMTCVLKKEYIDNIHGFEGNSVANSSTIGGFNYIATPSIPFLKSITSDINFSFERVNWNKLVKPDPTGLTDYILRRRITAICEKKS
jgi:protein-L-isoaspartate O-methyltransferase